jgi:hypothetical protein
MDRETATAKVEVLEGEKDMLSGSLFQASLPVVGTLIGLGIARWRLKVAKRRLAELQAAAEVDEELERGLQRAPRAGENPDAEILNREALAERAAEAQ